MDIPIPIDLGRIAQDLQIRRVQVESVVQLLDAGNTVPFITRYRKEQTGNLNEVVIFEIEQRVKRQRELVERKLTILKTIEAQGKLTEDLAAAIRGAESMKRLEDLYLPYKPKKRTKATEARERGLEPLAFRIWTRDETLGDLAAAALEMVNPEKGLDNVEKVLEGVKHILAEAVSEMAAVRDGVRRVVWKTGKIVTSRADIPEGQGLEYRDYFNYSEPVSQIPPHRVLAINRGDKEGPLKIKLEVSRPDAEAALFHHLPLEGHPHAEIFREAAVDALDRLLMPSMEREVRRDLTDMAERHAVEVFARNLRGLLLQPPIPKQTVLAIDPGFRTGCKVAVLTPGGELLDHGVIYPHAPQNRRSEAKLFLKDLVGKHQVSVVAIGNGTACRETEELVAEIITEGAQFLEAAPFLEDGSRPGAAALMPQPAPEAESSTETPAAAHEEDSAATETAPEMSERNGSGESENLAAAAASPAAEDAAAATAEEPAHTISLENPPPISGGSGDESSPASDPAPPPAESPVAESAVIVSGESAPAVADAAPVAGDAAPVAGEAASGTSEAESSPAAAAGQEVPTQTAETEAGGSGTTTPAPLGSQARSGKGREGGIRSRSRSGRSGQGKHDRSRAPRLKLPPAQNLPPAPHPADQALAQLVYIVVNEAGASVYSTSNVGREELPECDSTLRSSISIGRRLQDPLSELVKIEPQNIGVGLYQHDVNLKQLKEMLDTVITSCVNFVGVDLNTASASLLRHVSGLNELTAKNVVEHRKANGPYRSREQLVNVTGVGPARFTQAAGFLKINEGDEPLDATWIHPENYPAARALLEKVGAAPDVVRDKTTLKEVGEKLAALDRAAIAAELQLGEFTLRDILDALGRPSRDPREDLPKPIFKKGVLKIEDLTPGMELKGTVLNVVDFGAFVDIGLKDSGLVHISQLANRYIKSPHDVITVGDVVTVWVMGVDNDRKRVSLTMVKPGTERPRGSRAEGKRGEAEPRERGPRDNRQPAQRPRPSGSSLTSPPVGAAPLTEHREVPPRRHDRGRGEGGHPGRTDEAGRRGPQDDHRQSGDAAASGRSGNRPHHPDSRRHPRDDSNRGGRPQGGRQRSSAPLPPLSEDALAGREPLRSFGQLNQLWQARKSDDVPPRADTPANQPVAAVAASEPSNADGAAPATHESTDS